MTSTVFARLGERGRERPLGQPDPKPYLRPGDVMELEIDGLGRQRQQLVQA